MMPSHIEAKATFGKCDRLLIPESIRDAVLYDPETGVFSRAVTSQGIKKGHVYTAMHSTSKYPMIPHLGKAYFAHRVAWFLMTGEQPGECLDHADGDKTNNRWSNIRNATRRQNNCNTIRQPGREFKYPLGVTRQTRGGRYLARITVNGHRVVLGRFDTVEEAAAAYRAAALKYHGAFAVFLREAA